MTEENSRDLEQGSHCRDHKPLGRGVYQQPFFVREKGWEEPTSNKLETPKSVPTLPALLDGGFALSSKHSKEGRLHVKTGFEGCILFSSIKSCIQKICAVSLVREALRVPLPLFWTTLSIKDFYKITQNSNFSVVLPEHTKYNLLGRHVADRPYNRRNVIGQRHSNLPSSTTRVSRELKKKKSVLTPTQRIEFLGVTVDLLIMILSLPEKKISKVQKQCQKLNKTNRLIVFNYSSSISSINKF